MSIICVYHSRRWVGVEGIQCSHVHSLLRSAPTFASRIFVSQGSTGIYCILRQTSFQVDRRLTVLSCSTLTRRIRSVSVNARRSPVIRLTLGDVVCLMWGLHTRTHHLVGYLSCIMHTHSEYAIKSYDISITRIHKLTHAIPSPSVLQCPSVIFWKMFLPLNYSRWLVVGLSEHTWLIWGAISSCPWLHLNSNLVFFPSARLVSKASLWRSSHCFFSHHRR